MKTYTFVANWKMNFSFNQAVAFAKANKEGFSALAQRQHTQIILCPSFESIASVHAVLKGTGVFIGAQDCAEHMYGNYTGQVAAQSLKEAGCDYILIGHNERRMHMQETIHDVARKLVPMLLSSINPIICFGEDITAYDLKDAFEEIRAQAHAIRSGLKTVDKRDPNFCLYLAYEPAWAIGTGNVAPPEHVVRAFDIMLEIIQELIPRSALRMLYGGSIRNDNHETLIKIKELDGFLIGKASLDFQSFKKILDYTAEKASQ